MSDSKNPYEAPTPASQQLAQALGTRMLYRSLGLIVAATCLFGAGGALVGWLLALLTPDYYRAVFELDPGSPVWQIGVGLGLAQGLVAGVVVGCCVVLATAIYRSRIRKGMVGELEAWEQYRQSMSHGGHSTSGGHSEPE